MDTLALQRQFSRAVAPLEIGEGTVTVSGRRATLAPGQFTLDVGHAGRDESFVLRLGEGAEERWRFTVANADPKRRHLLFVATAPETERIRAAERHFLCGHDERHLFVAGLTERVATVAAAMDSLKPAAVREAELERGVRPKMRNRHRNAAFVRQGEWFFLPRPDFVPASPALTLHDEPISRGRGKAHLVEHLYRVVSHESVWVCRRFPEGISEALYQRVLASNHKAHSWTWRRMRLTTEAYARGRVRHLDHATIFLPCWHLIVPSAEAGSNSATGRSVAFLD